MRTISSTLLAVGLHVVALAGLVHASLATELPPNGYVVVHGGGAWYIGPSVHVGELLLGGTEHDVRAHFGDPRQALDTDGRDGRRCLLYRFASSDLLVLLLERGVVTRTWVVRESEAPAACAGLAEREVAVTARSVWIGP